MGHIAPDKRRLAAFCRKHHIRRLSLFGSALREDFRPDSDVDVLVEFQPEHTPGLQIVDIADELSDLFGGHKVDLVNPRYLNQRIKDHVLASAEVQYAQNRGHPPSGRA